MAAAVIASPLSVFVAKKRTDEQYNFLCPTPPISYKPTPFWCRFIVYVIGEAPVFAVTVLPFTV